MKKKFDLKARVQNKAFWIALFAIIALTGKVFGIYEVPEDWDVWVNAVLALLSAVGVIMNPASEGILD